MVPPSIKDGLKDLIREGLAVDYVSKSCLHGLQTGNHYQTVTLDGVASNGFRSRREHVIDRVIFEGKRVLDLGSNLGELSRAARARGAYLVDGWEYDSYFIELANLINAANDVTRVSFFERDITRRSIYAQNYDVVLAFSVFPYIEPVLDALANVTKDLLILETHKLEGDLESYIEPVSEYFSSYEIIGRSEWGKELDARERRAVIAFAHRPSAIEKGLRRL